MPTPTIAVLLTCHNRKDKTLQCLTALYAQTGIAEAYTIEVFLVDDASTDGTGEAIKKQFPEVNIILGNGDLYWNRGMLLAWETAANIKEYDYYLWLNDDTILFEFALGILIEKGELTFSKQILVGATISEISKNITYTGFKFDKVKISPNNDWQKCDFFNGNIVLIPNFVFLKVGFLDKCFSHALGDFDYGMRASKLGFEHLLATKPLGICESNDVEPIWRRPQVSLFKRIKYLYTPLGNNPIEFFIIDYRKNGVFSAIFHFCTIHLRVFLPRLWK